MSDSKLILEYVFDHERDHPDRVFLTQPYDGGKTIDYTWGQVTARLLDLYAEVLHENTVRQ